MDILLSAILVKGSFRIGPNPSNVLNVCGALSYSPSSPRPPFMSPSSPSHYICPPVDMPSSSRSGWYVVRFGGHRRTLRVPRCAHWTQCSSNKTCTASPQVWAAPSSLGLHESNLPSTPALSLLTPLAVSVASPSDTTQTPSSTASASGGSVR